MSNTDWRRALAEEMKIAISLKEPASKLRNKDLVELCRHLCGDDGGYSTYMVIVEALGMKDMVASLQCSSSLEKMIKLITRWTERDGSTVGMLIKTLKDLPRPDCIEFIENVARYRFTSLYIILHVMKASGEQIEEIRSDRISEPISLQQYVGTRISNYISTNLPTGLNHCYRIDLKQLQGLDWKSTAKDYEGRQIDLYLYNETSEKRQIGSKSDQIAASQLQAEKRNGMLLEISSSRPICITTYQNLHFGYYAGKLIQSATPESENSAGSADEFNDVDLNASSRLESPVTPDIQYPTNASKQESSLSLELRSVHSTSLNSLESLGRSPTEVNVASTFLQQGRRIPQPESTSVQDCLSEETATIERIALSEGSTHIKQCDTLLKDKEWDEVSVIEGFHDMKDTPSHERQSKADDVLKDHYKVHKEDGRYLIRLSRSQSTRFTLTYIHKGSITHISILNKSDRYFLTKSKQGFASIQDLIQYYKDNNLEEGGRLTLPVCV